MENGSSVHVTFRPETCKSCVSLFCILIFWNASSFEKGVEELTIKFFWKNIQKYLNYKLYSSSSISIIIFPVKLHTVIALIDTCYVVQIDSWRSFWMTHFTCYSTPCWFSSLQFPTKFERILIALFNEFKHDSFLLRFVFESTIAAPGPFFFIQTAKKWLVLSTWSRDGQCSRNLMANWGSA